MIGREILAMTDDFRPCLRHVAQDRFSVKEETLPPPVFPVRTPLVQGLLVTRRPPNVDRLASHDRAFLIDAGPDESDAYLRDDNGYHDAAGMSIGDGTNPQPGVRLLAYYTPACLPPFPDADDNPGSARGLAILLHGWEGSSHAMFNLVLGETLSRAGYEVVRLNLRDHGPRVRVDPVTLNTGLFMATLLNEVRRAVAGVASLAKDKPVFLIGPSMGGNFALRLAAQPDAASSGDNPERAVLPPNLRHVIALSPVLNPAATIDRLDETYFFRRYFRTRWLHTLQRKAATFPHRYDFSGIERLNQLRPMTEWLARRHTHFESADAYFAAYAFLDEDSRALSVPTTILSSVDDPIVPVEEIASLADSPYLTRRIYSWGGHVGLIAWPPLRYMLPEIILQILSTGE
jgi:uncharacterized protein